MALDVKAHMVWYSFSDSWQASGLNGRRLVGVHQGHGNISCEAEKIKRLILHGCTQSVKLPGIVHCIGELCQEQWPPPFSDADVRLVVCNVFVHPIGPTHVLVVHDNVVWYGDLDDFSFTF